MINIKNLFLLSSMFIFCSHLSKADSIAVDYIRHKTNGKYIFRLSDKKVRVFVRCKKNDVEKAVFVYLDKGVEKNLKMSDIGSVNGKRYFYLDFDFNSDNISYYFVLGKGKDSYKYLDNESMFNVSLPQLNNKRVEAPSVWYQILVDRFRNGDPYNDPKLEVWNNSWMTFSEDEKKFITSNKWYTMPFNRKYGGDLKGIIEMSDYISNLGVDAILLSPIFYSKSSNKHDVLDHLTISQDIAITDNATDIDFLSSINNIETEGDKEDKEDQEEINDREINIKNSSLSNRLVEYLVKLFHKKKIKVFVEFPLYTSREHFAFKDIEMYQKRSKFYDWYIWENDKPKTLDESNSILLLNLNNSEVLNYLLNSLKMLKELNFDGVMINNLTEYSALAYFKENIDLEIVYYPFSSKEMFNKNSDIDMTINNSLLVDILRVLNSFSLNSAADLKTILELNRLRLGNSNSVSAISTVDTERILSAIINYDEPSGYVQENPTYKRISPKIWDSSVLDKLRLVLSILVTYSESVMLAYGEESGMYGGADPDSKKPMIWEDLEPYDKNFDDLDKYPNISWSDIDQVNGKIYYRSEVDKKVVSTYKDLLRFKRDNLDLFKNSKVKFLDISGDSKKDVLVYYREYNGRVVLVALNISKNSARCNLSFPKSGNYIDLMTKKAYDVRGSIDDFSLNAFSSAIFILE